MRRFKIVSRSLLGVLAAVLLLNFVGCRRTVTPVTIVNLSPPVGVYPVLHIGQVLVWESPQNGPAFMVKWLNDKSPCKEGSPIVSSLVRGRQTVDCTVIRLPPSGIPFQYGILPVTGGSQPKPDTHFFDDDGVVPCTGCYFTNEDDFSGDARSADVSSDARAAVARLVLVSCDSSGKAQLYPGKVPLASLNQIVKWEELAGPTQQPVFTPPQPPNSCSSTTAPYSCSSAKSPTFPVIYSMIVASTCANDSGLVTLQGEIDAPRQ